VLLGDLWTTFVQDAPMLGLHALQHLGLNALAPMTETVKAKLHRVMLHATREHT